MPRIASNRHDAIFLGYMLAFGAVYLGTVAYSILRIVFYPFGLYGSNVVINQQQAGVQEFAAASPSASVAIVPLFFFVVLLMVMLVFFSYRSFKRASLRSKKAINPTPQAGRRVSTWQA